MKKQIKVIDIFSGPGGLGEGFASFKNNKDKKTFKIAISIEKELSAFRTLKLRAFCRQFPKGVPVEYYDFLKGELGVTPEEQLYKLPKFSKIMKKVDAEAQQLELGKDNDIITQKISNAIGNDDCILIGGPPCQAYSLAGRSRNIGIANYKAESDHRNFLYKEYLKVISQFQPIAFIMENVKGMLSAKVNGVSIYDSIMADLKTPNSAVNIKPISGLKAKNYQIFSFIKQLKDNEKIDPRDFIIKSENYGIPQRRHRVILLGLRSDHANKFSSESLLEKIKENVTVDDVISDLPILRSGLSKETNNDSNWLKTIKNSSKSTIKSLKKHGYDDVATEFVNVVNNLKLPKLKQGSNFGLKRNRSILNNHLRHWYFDGKLDNYITNNETRGHIAADLQRYLFCSVWAKVNLNKQKITLSPKAKDYPEQLMPNHKNFKSGKFTDRFRVQAGNISATTITSHISKDGHYFIHPDPYQCRSLTVREAARIQTFPDNYFFVGNRTQQYVQVGNAVPPLLANKLASVVNKILNL